MKDTLTLIEEHPILSSICLRVAIALLSVTFFQPDEYFQALEPAHLAVFGYGHLTWEWRSQQPIRSIFHPMLFAPVYWILKSLRLDNGNLLILGPKFVQGLFASVTDIAIRQLTRNVHGERYVSTAFFLSITSIFHVQALSRTLSNSFETSLTTLALANWPLSSLPASQTLFVRALVAAVIACMARPTNAIVWVYLLLELSWRSRHHLDHLIKMWLCVCVTCAASCALLLLLDSWYFGKPTFTPLNFLRTNLMISTFYGRNPWHYYLSQAFPIICNISTIIVLQGIWESLRSGLPPAKRLAGLVFWTVGVYSLASHKEWRFIHPLLPVMHVLAAKVLVDAEKQSAKPPSPLLWACKKYRTILSFVFFLATPYLLFVQSRAQIAVMHHIRSIPESHVKSIGFLMPCHSTPWQSYLHREHLTSRRLWFIGCEPPLEGQSLEDYRDQSDVFYTSPVEYLRKRFPRAVDPSFPPSPHATTIPGFPEDKNASWVHFWPSHLVMFGSLLSSDGVRNLLESIGYREEWRTWNGWEQDERRRGGMRVWSWELANEERSREIHDGGG